MRCGGKVVLTSAGRLEMRKAERDGRGSPNEMWSKTEF